VDCDPVMVSGSPMDETLCTFSGSHWGYRANYSRIGVNGVLGLHLSDVEV